jgi:hypothetical protein
LNICRKHYFVTNYQDIIELIIWSIAHIADSSLTCRDYVLSSPILKDIIELSKSGSCTLDIIRCYLWLFSKLFIPAYEKPKYEFMLEIFYILLNHLYIDDNEVIINTITGMYNIMELEYDNIYETVLDSGAVVKILKRTPTFNQMKRPMVLFIGSLLNGNKTVISVFLFKIRHYLTLMYLII